MKNQFERFMKQTMKAHELQVWSIYDATSLMPGREPNYWDAKELAANTDYFERKNIIIDPENYSYPPQRVLVPSFKKWLALQKHDVKAVNSLYAHKKAVTEKLYEVYGNIGELEELPEVMRPFVESAIKRLEQDAERLRELRRTLSAAIDAVKATGKAKAVAA